MPVFTVTRRMGFAPEFLYGICADVARYSEFLPLCTASRVWDAAAGPDGKCRFRAELVIAYAKLNVRETFISSVTADPARLTVRALSSEGAVRHVDNRWLFHQAGGGTCDVEVYVDYDMATRPLRLIMSAMFDYAMRKVMNAFEERAHVLKARETSGQS